MKRNSMSFRERKVPNCPPVSLSRQQKVINQSPPIRNFVIKSKRVISVLSKNNQEINNADTPKSKKYEQSFEQISDEHIITEKINPPQRYRPKRPSSKILSQLMQNGSSNDFQLTKYNNNFTKKTSAVAFIRKKKKKIEKFQEKTQNNIKVNGFKDQLCESIVFGEKTVEDNRNNFVNNSYRHSISDNNKENSHRHSLSNNNNDITSKSIKKSIESRNSKSRNRKINECKTRKIKWGGKNAFNPKISVITTKQVEKQAPPQSLKELFEQLI